MLYQLYGDIGSGSAAVELALAEIGVEVDLCEVPLHRNAQLGRDYAALNPQRKLPCLITPDQETLTESASILLTLDERHPHAGLLPADLRQRAFARRWLIFMAAELYPIIEIVDYPERFQPEGESTSAPRRAALRAHAEEIWRQRFLLVEQAVAGEQWFLPSGFSLLDIFASVLSRWTRPPDYRVTSTPRIERISAGVGERRRLDAVWRRHFAN